MIKQSIVLIREIKNQLKLNVPEFISRYKLKVNQRWSYFQQNTNGSEPIALKPEVS